MSIKLVSRSIWCNPGNRGQKVYRTASAVMWQMQKRLLKSKRRLKLVSGASFLAHPDCVVSSSLIYADYPEYHELKFIRSQLNASHVLIDIGANVGHIGLLLSDIIRAEHIIAFEPTPVTFRRLQENWSLNPQLGSPRLVQSAVGATDGEVQFPNSDSPVTTNSMVHGKGRTDSTITVPLARLDSLRSFWTGLPVGLLKIDVEGFEADVFRGAQETLKSDRPNLVMFESLSGRIEESIATILADAKYDIFQLDESGLPDYSRCDSQNIFAAPVERRHKIEALVETADRNG